MAEALKRKTTKGLFWNFLDKSGQQIIYLISGIILSRILFPEDLAITGALAIFIALSNVLVESGFGRALINKKEVTQKEYSTVFYFNTGISLFLYLILYIGAPYIAMFYDDERLISISRIYFLVIVINSFAVIQNTILTKEYKFKAATNYSMAALIIATISAIAAAYYGCGVWALVIQALLLATVKTLLLWVFTSWRPSFCFDFNVLKGFFSFSSKLLTAGMINAFFNNIYYLIVGYFYNMGQLGYFTQAYKYHEIPSGVVGNTFKSVAIPVFADVSEEKERVKRVLQKNIQLISFLIFPIMLMLIVFAEPLFLALITEKWLPSVPYFQILCVGGMFMPFTTVINEVFIARGNSRIFLWLEIVKRILLIALIVSLFSFSIMGLSFSWSLFSILTLLISIGYLKKEVGYSYTNMLRDASPYVLVAAVSTLSAWSVSELIDNIYLSLVTGALVCGLVYPGICYIFKLNSIKEFTEAISSKRKGNE